MLYISAHLRISSSSLIVIVGQRNGVARWWPRMKPVCSDATAGTRKASVLMFYYYYHHHDDFSHRVDICFDPLFLLRHLQPAPDHKGSVQRTALILRLLSCSVVESFTSRLSTSNCVVLIRNRRCLGYDKSLKSYYTVNCTQGYTLLLLF